MSNSEKIRILVWAVLATICLSFGVVGYYQVYSSNKLTSVDEQLLNTLINYFDNSDDFTNLRNVGIEINSKTKNNKIETEYKTESASQTYEFTYDKNSSILDFKCKVDDTVCTIMIKNMLDAVGIYNGKAKNEIGDIFSSITTLNEYTINDGLTYTEENGNMIVKINVNTALKELSTSNSETNNQNDNNNENTTSENYFTLDELTSKKDNIINGTFLETKGNIKMKTTKVNETLYISIFEQNKISSNSYNSLLSMLRLILDSDTYNAFTSSYDSFDKGNTKSNNINVEKDFIIPASYENDMVSNNGELVRISFNSSLISND